MRFIDGMAMALAGTLWASAASAQTITLREPDMIAELLRVEGYEATLDKVEAEADPIITGRKDGMVFGLYFANCDKGRSCQSVELYAAFRDHRLDHEKVNEWNREKRFAKAYIDKQALAALSMDINVEPGGMERELFVDHLEIWWSLLAQFEARAFPEEPEKATDSAK